MSLLRTAFAVRRGSGSFIADSMAMDDSSPAARLDARYPEQPRPLHTPAPPAAEAQRSGSGEAAHGPDSSSSSLSGAATSRAPLAAGLAGDPWGGGDMSPALLRRPEPERRVPSCPHKQGSNPAKRHTAVASPPADVTEEIRPRTLDMTRSPNDPNDMSLSPMNLASAGGISPSPGPPAAGAGRRHGVRPPERPEREGRVKKMRLQLEAIDGAAAARAAAAAHAAAAASGGGGGGGLCFDDEPPDAPMGPPPPPLRHQSSLGDVRVLQMNREKRSISFSEPAQFKFDQHFVWQKKLGAGCFSEVWAVRHAERPDEGYAIKVSHREFRSRAERDEYLREVRLANDMPAHPNVVEYIRAWQDQRHFYVQMELCEGGTLQGVLDRDGEALRAPAHEPRVWEVARGVARGLEHIHSYEVIHCDLKPDNILIGADGTLKIGDLGQATALGKWDDQEGDGRYLSRDLLDCNPSTAADVFSFGLILYQIKSGAPLPIAGDSEEASTQWDFLRSGRAPPPPGTGAELGALIHAMMGATPEARPSAADVVAAACNAAANAAAAAAIAAAAAATAAA